MPVRLTIEGSDVDWQGPYTDYLLGLGLDPKTIVPYLSKLCRVRVWAAEHDTTIDMMTARQVNEMAKTFKPSISSQGQLRAALKHYWESTERFPNPYKAIRLPREEPPPPKPLDREHAQAMVKASLGWHPEGLAVLAGLYLGLRRETIAQMRWDGFDPNFSWYRFKTKNRRVLTRPVHPVLREELQGRETAYVWIFPGQRGRSYVNPATIALWVDRVARAAGIEEHVAPHRLRHTVATEMNDRTGRLGDTAAFLGHVKVTTTQRYTRIKGHRMEEAMMAGLDYFDDTSRPIGHDG